MQATLEDVLREKEGELKLYQRFLNLKTFMEERIFPHASLSLRQHIEGIKSLTEQLIPEPRARTEEMFSGEIFVLLCLFYLHDSGAVSLYDWNGNNDIFDSRDKSTKTLILNRHVAELLDIPASAIEIVNSLIFYPAIKKVAPRWEIKEDSSRAIIRNTKAVEAVFSFAHLLWDVFFLDYHDAELRRYPHPNLRTNCCPSSITVDSREGIISIQSSPVIPYQRHMLTMVKSYVESAFRRFKEAMNGKLGFQYRSLIWEIDELPFARAEGPEDPESLSFRDIDDEERWQEASLVLDTLFKNGQVIITGRRGCGKTYLMENFLLPQLRKISLNVYRCDVWEQPVSELRQVVARTTDEKQPSADMVSVCHKLRQGGPCFFILDGCERLQDVGEAEKEKLKRFVDFCRSSEDLYLLTLGDKETFFEWYYPFRGSNFSTVFEVQSPQSDRVAARFASWELLKSVINETLKKSEDEGEVREVIAALAGDASNSLARYTLADIRSETGLPLVKIVGYLSILKDKGIIKEHRSFDSTYYNVAGRQVAELLREHLGLTEFDEKKEMRRAINEALENGTWLSRKTMDAVDRWADKLIFDGEEKVVILGSAIHTGCPWTTLLSRFEKVSRQGLGMRGARIMRLLEEQDPEKRKEAIRLLSRIRDDHVTNDLLLHLESEQDYAVRGLILETLLGMGKKKSLVALAKTLSDIDDREWKMQAIELLAAGDAAIARDALLILAEMEKDAEIQEAIEKVFFRLEESL